jgi:signal transduction histidine kinase
MALEAKNKELVSLSSKRLYDIFKSQNKQDSCLVYLEKYMVLNEEIARNKFDFSFNLLDLSNKEKIILSQENKIQKNNLWVVSVAALFLLSTLSFYIYWKIKKNNQEKLLLRMQQQQQQQLEIVMHHTQTEERTRISSHLHDSVVQKLVVAKMNLETIQKNSGLNDRNKQDILQSVYGLINETTNEVRTLSHSLMPTNLETEGLAEAVKDIVKNIKLPHLVINVYDEGNFLELNTPLAIISCRIVQEILQNILKHAMAKVVNIHLDKTEHELNISIDDDGIGFDVERSKINGIGIQNMIKRVEQINGVLDIESAIGKGTMTNIKIRL